MTRNVGYPAKTRSVAVGKPFPAKSRSINETQRGLGTPSTKGKPKDGKAPKKGVLSSGGGHG